MKTRNVIGTRPVRRMPRKWEDGANLYPRALSGEFDYDLAYNYATRALRGAAANDASADSLSRLSELPKQGNGTQRAASDAPETVRARRTAGTRAFDPSAVDDVCQSAALLWWESRRDKETGEKQEGIDARTAVRTAVQRWRRAERKASANARSEPPRFSCRKCSRKAPCQDCQDRRADDIAMWSLAQYWGGGAGEAMETVADYRTDWTRAMLECADLDDAFADCGMVRQLVRFIASGSSVKDVSIHFRIAESSVHKLLGMLRGVLTEDMLTAERKGHGPAGQRHRGEELPPLPAPVRRAPEASPPDAMAVRLLCAAYDGNQWDGSGI